jgi:protein-histidine pros-kinase
LPTGVLLLDYGLRLFVIGLAAWWGSRWLARPMRQMVSAAQALGPALAAGNSPPALDESQGTREVRSAAGVFNDMARRIQRQFRERGLMIAAISHDLRTPLTRMRLRVETAELPERLRERCTADLQEMNALIDTVLEVFREPGEGAHARQRTDLTALVQALVDDRDEQGAKVSLTGPTVIATTDALMLKRVLGNLIDNALRYAGQADVEIAADCAAAEVHIDVLDRGPGIPEDRLEAVLQPFVRVEGSRNPGTGGTGLGLYIARELVTRLGGRFALRNRPEGGLHAEVVLPLV